MRLIIRYLQIVCLVSSTLYGASFTVTSGETVGAQTLSDPEDSGTVEAGGTISSGASVGVTMSNTDQLLKNAGTITTTGNNAYGVSSTSSGAQFN